MQEHIFNLAMIRLFQKRALLAFRLPNESLDDPFLVTPNYVELFLRLHPDAEDVTEQALRKLLQ